MNFKYAVFGMFETLLWMAVNKQSIAVTTRLIVVEKWVSSLRYNGTIVMTIIASEGMYA